MLLKSDFAASADGIVRCRWFPTNPLPRRSWDVLTPLSFDAPASIETDEEGNWRWLPIQGSPLSGHFPEAREAQLAALPVLKTRPGDKLPAGPAQIQMTLRLQRQEGAAYFGVGQRMSRMRRDPGTYHNWTTDPLSGHGRSSKAMYQAHPFLFMQSSAGCQGIYLHTSFYNNFDLFEKDADQIILTLLGGQVELYLLPGPTPAQVLEQLTRLTGRPLMPPMWALGHHQSRWGYGSQDEISDMIREYRTRHLPLDVVHLDIDYMHQYRSFTFHPERFPDPARMARAAFAQGVRLVTIIDPGIRFDLETDYEVARSGTRGGHFLKNPDGSPLIGYCWPDTALFTDYTSVQARAWWGEQQHVLVDAGISGIWVDMNEPAIFARPFSEGHSEQHPMPLATQHSEGSTHAEVHNLYGHLMSVATFEGLQRLRPQERPWVLTRSATVGTQAYAISWMGDNNSWWEHLELTLGQLVNMGLSGSPWVGVDVGGFFDNCNGELLMRWYEQGIFYPFLRNHSATGTRPQEPWRFGEECQLAIQRCLELRYRLLPYLYSLGHQAHTAGTPILRPLFWEFPQDALSVNIDNQAMVGPSLLIAPIVRPGIAQRAVYLPPGRWCNFWDQRIESGPAWIIDTAPYGQPILWMREGGCVPLGNVRQHTGEPLEKLVWRVFPGEGECFFACMRDDGITPQAPVSRLELRVVDGHAEWSGAPVGLKRHAVDIMGQHRSVDLPPTEWGRLHIL